MNISFLITVHNETESLKKLLDQIHDYINFNRSGDECIILDDFSTDIDTINILDEFKSRTNFHCYKSALEKNYGRHKTIGNAYCNSPMICQLDADEYLQPTLLYNLKAIINANPTIELFWIPRINIVKGMTEEHIKRWGWRITTSKIYNVPLINFPDYQSRAYSNKPYIKWDRKLHECIVGNKTYAYLPPEEEYAILHEKTIEVQEATNQMYIREFTADDNVRTSIKPS